MTARIEYIEWIEPRLDQTHDLGSSDLAGSWPTDPDAILARYSPDKVPEPTVAEFIAREYGVDPERVLVTAGASHANFLAFAAALDPDESTPPGERGRVLVEWPGYEPLVRTPEQLGAVVDRFHRLPDRAYQLDPGRVRAALTDRTSLVVTTNRHNPSGKLTDRETLADVAEVAGDTRLLVDEVYEPFVDRTQSADGSGRAFGGPTAAGIENVVVTGSMTKFFGLGALGLGWLIADPEFVDRARRLRYHVPAVAETSRALARQILADVDSLACDARALLERNTELLDAFCAARTDLSDPVDANVTFRFLTHDRADGDEVAAAAESEGVLVVPGRFFDEPDHFRVSVSGPVTATKSALDAFGDVLDGL